jgi:hypothetical protein
MGNCFSNGDLETSEESISIATSPFRKNPSKMYRKDSSRETQSFPMYVMHSMDFLSLTELGIPTFEWALANEKLFEVVECPDRDGYFYLYQTGIDRTRGTMLTVPGTRFIPIRENRASFIAISHQWFQPNRNPNEAHPDSKEHIKFKALQSYIKQKKINGYFWMDYFSIPQALDPESQALQKDALNSIGFYFMFSSNLLVLCKDFENLLDSDNGYLSRGICLLELATSKLPRIDIFGKWYIPGFDVDGQWGKSEALLLCNGMTIPLDWKFYERAKCPMKAKFTNPHDKAEVFHLVNSYANEYEKFYADYLSPIRNCVSWDKVTKIPFESLPQLWKADILFQTPKEFVDAYLPYSFIKNLLDESSGNATSDL